MYMPTTIRLHLRSHSTYSSSFPLGHWIRDCVSLCGCALRGHFVHGRVQFLDERIQLNKKKKVNKTQNTHIHAVVNRDESTTHIIWHPHTHTQSIVSNRQTCHQNRIRPAHLTTTTTIESRSHGTRRNDHRDHDCTVLSRACANHLMPPTRRTNHTAMADERKRVCVCECDISVCVSWCSGSSDVFGWFFIWFSMCIAYGANIWPLLLVGPNPIFRQVSACTTDWHVVPLQICVYIYSYYLPWTKKRTFPYTK